MKIDRYRFTRREPRSLKIFFAILAAVWLAVYLIGQIIINWRPA